MSQTDKKRVAIVTGASRGIGTAIALRLAKDGFAVAINYASSAKEADALADEVRAAGGAAIAVKADVAIAEDVRGMFAKVEAELGRIDVLFNNAGVLNTMPLADTSDALYEQTMNINLRGTFNTLREAAARMNETADASSIFRARHRHSRCRVMPSTRRPRRPSKRSRTSSRRNCAVATSR